MSIDFNLLTQTSYFHKIFRFKKICKFTFDLFSSKDWPYLTVRLIMPFELPRIGIYSVHLFHVLPNILNSEYLMYIRENSLYILYTWYSIFRMSIDNIMSIVIFLFTKLCLFIIAQCQRFFSYPMLNCHVFLSTQNPNDFTKYFDDY